jgi:hypothetical protein
VKKQGNIEYKTAGVGYASIEVNRYQSHYMSTYWLAIPAFSVRYGISNVFNLVPTRKQLKVVGYITLLLSLDIQVLC